MQLQVALLLSKTPLMTNKLECDCTIDLLILINGSRSTYVVFDCY
jgi:hypothetical protein